MVLKILTPFLPSLFSTSQAAPRPSLATTASLRPRMSSSSELAPHVMAILARQLRQLSTAPPPGVRYVPSETSLSEVLCELEGPRGTPYEGGSFACKLTLGADFPNAPPKGACDNERRGRGQARPEREQDDGPSRRTRGAAASPRPFDSPHAPRHSPPAFFPPLFRLQAASSRRSSTRTSPRRATSASTRSSATGSPSTR